MKTIRFFNIDWDTDGEEVNLPKEVILEVENDVDVSLEGADLLSDKYGWCVNGFTFTDEALEHAFLNQIETDLDERDFDAFSEMFVTLITNCPDAEQIIHNYLSDTAQQNLKEGLTHKRY